MAADYGIAIEIDSTVSNNKKAEILRKVIQALETETISVATEAGAFSSAGTYQARIAVT